MKWFIALELLLAATAFSGYALAADAEELVRQGVDLRRRHRDDEALKVFQQAAELEPAPRTIAQMGLAEQALGKWADADRHLREALRAADDQWIRKNRRTLEAAIKTVAAHVGSLEVSGAPEGAEVRVDGELVGRLPLPASISVAAGRVAIEVRSSGYMPIVRAADVKVGELTRENFRLQSLGQGGPSDGATQPPPVASASSRPVAQPTALAQPVAPSAPIAAAGDALSGQASADSPEASPAADTGISLRYGLAIAATGLGAAALAAGIVEHLAWQKNVRSFSDTMGCDPARADKGGSLCKQYYDDGNTAKTVTFVGYGLSAAFIATAAVLVLTAPPSGTQPPTSVARTSGVVPLACAINVTTPGVGCSFRF